MIKKLLFADCYGVVYYENATDEKIIQLQRILSLNEHVYPSLCLLFINEEIDAQITSLLSNHKFDEAVKFVKHIVVDLLFIGEKSLENWALIPNEKLDKTK